jgi:hypothetical protein
MESYSELLRHDQGTSNADRNIVRFKSQTSEGEFIPILKIFLWPISKVNLFLF